MKIRVRIVVRKAAPAPNAPGLWSVYFGHGDSFTYCGHFTAGSYEDLRAEVNRVADLATIDDRLSDWPGINVSAENIGDRKPNKWADNKPAREAFRRIARPVAV